jgi:hypothetical protein
MHQESPAVRGRKNFLNEKTVHAIVGTAVRERKVQRPLHLPAELPGFPFGLTVRRRVARFAFVQSFDKIRIDKL